MIFSGTEGSSPAPGQAPSCKPHGDPHKRSHAAATCHLSSAFPQPSLFLASCQDMRCSLSTGRYCHRTWHIKPPLQSLRESPLDPKSMFWAGETPRQISWEAGVSMRIFWVPRFGDPRRDLHSGWGQEPLVLQVLNIPFDGGFANPDLI